MGGTPIFQEYSLTSMEAGEKLQGRMRTVRKETVPPPRELKTAYLEG